MVKLEAPLYLISMAVHSVLFPCLQIWMVLNVHFIVILIGHKEGVFDL